MSKKMKDGTKVTLEIPTNAEIVWRALTMHISDWWGRAQPICEEQGDIFTVSWGEPWYRFKILEAIPHSLLVWQCVDANQIIPNTTGVQKEWVDTKVHWRLLAGRNGRTVLDFHHEGLTTALACHDFCSRTWHQVLTTSLKSYLEKGPNI